MRRWARQAGCGSVWCSAWTDSSQVSSCGTSAGDPPSPTNAPLSSAAMMITHPCSGRGAGAGGAHQLFCADRRARAVARLFGQGLWRPFAGRPAVRAAAQRQGHQQQQHVRAAQSERRGVQAVQQIRLRSSCRGTPRVPRPSLAVLRGAGRALQQGAWRELRACAVRLRRHEHPGKLNACRDGRDAGHCACRIEAQSGTCRHARECTQLPRAVDLSLHDELELTWRAHTPHAYVASLRTAQYSNASGEEAWQTRIAPSRCGGLTGAHL